MPLFLAVRQSSNPTISPQRQNTHFHEQKGALPSNAPPYATARDAHISFPEANKEEKKPLRCFPEMLGVKVGPICNRRETPRRTKFLCALFLICCCLLAPKNETSPGPCCTNTLSVCSLCQPRRISTSFYSVMLCQ